VLLVVGPHLAVDVRILRRHHRRLGRGRLPLLRERVHRHFMGLAMDPGDAGLVHPRDPDVVIAGDLNIEAPLRRLRLEYWDRNLLRLAGLGMETAGELRAEVGIPDHAVAIDDHVVRLRLFARQVELGDDNAGRAALRARLGLEVVLGAFRIAERDAAAIARACLPPGAGYPRALAAPPLHNPPRP